MASKSKRLRQAARQAVRRDQAAIADSGATSDLGLLAQRLAARQARAARAADRGEPTPEQLARNLYGNRKILDPESQHPRHARCILTSNSVDRYKARGLIDERQWLACAKYREDYLRAGFERPITGSYEFSGAGGGGAGPNMTGTMAATVAQHDARLRLRQARAAMPQRLLAGFDGMVVHDDDASEIGEADGRAPRLAASFAIERLRICASELADYYRLPGGEA